MAKCLFQVSVFVLAISQAIESRAQVLNAPSPRSHGGVQQAGGQVVTAQPSAVDQTGWGIPMPRITMRYSEAATRAHP